MATESGQPGGSDVVRKKDLEEALAGVEAALDQQAQLLRRTHTWVVLLFGWVVIVGGLTIVMRS